MNEMNIKCQKQIFSFTFTQILFALIIFYGLQLSLSSAKHDINQDRLRSHIQARTIFTRQRGFQSREPVKIQI